MCASTAAPVCTRGSTARRCLCPRRMCIFARSTVCTSTTLRHSTSITSCIGGLGSQTSRSRQLARAYLPRPQPEVQSRRRLGRRALGARPRSQRTSRGRRRCHPSRSARRAAQVTQARAPCPAHPLHLPSIGCRAAQVAQATALQPTLTLPLSSIGCRAAQVAQPRALWPTPTHTLSSIGRVHGGEGIAL